MNAAARPATPGFVELAPPSASQPSAQCVIEFEDGKPAASMRVHLTGYDAPDLVALGRSFLERASDAADHAANEDSGRCRTGRFPQRESTAWHRLCKDSLKPRSLRRCRVRVSQSKKHGDQGAGLRRPRLLALSQAPFRADGLLAGGPRWRSEDAKATGGGRSSALGPVLGRESGSELPRAPDWRPVGPRSLTQGCESKLALAPNQGGSVIHSLF